MPDVSNDPQVTPELRITDQVKGPIPPRVMNASWPNVIHTRISTIVEEKGPAPWTVRVIDDERTLVTLIATPPGSGNRPHWHKDFDEWWVVMAGRLQWELTGGVVVQAQKDGIVWVPRGTVHHITTVGDEMSLRLAVAMPPGLHIYGACEQCGYSDDGPPAWDMQ